MPNDINELDVNDIGLKGIFGERFHDETARKVTDEQFLDGIARSFEAVHGSKKPAQKPIQKVRDAEWEPEPHEPTQMEKIKACAKDALLFGGLSLMFFWFQQTGQMAMSASMPCIVACVALAGFGVGKNFAGGDRR